MVKMTVKMEKNHSRFLDGKHSDDLKYWKHSCLLCFSVPFIICYLLALQVILFLLYHYVRDFCYFIIYFFYFFFYLTMCYFSYFKRLWWPAIHPLPNWSLVTALDEGYESMSAPAGSVLGCCMPLAVTPRQHHLVGRAVMLLEKRIRWC